MNKYFNDVQMLKSSENCYKYSKSVSYETLVGGTTIGRSEKQNQGLNGRSELMPLFKAGTFASLLGNFAKVLEKRLQIKLVFRLVKVLNVVAVLSLNLSTAWAADSGTCGDGCNWNFDGSTGALTLSGNGTMDDYDVDWDADPDGQGKTPWQDYISDIKSVAVAEGSTLSNIGDNAFWGAKALENIDIPNIRDIGNSAFYKATSLTSVDLPSLEKIGDLAFGATGLTYLNVPTTAQYCIPDGGDEEDCYDIGEGIYNGILSTENLLAQMYNNGSCSNSNGFIICGNLTCGEGQIIKDKKCIDASLGCGAGYRQFENWCNRIQYTPAEAAPLLNDDDNFVILTFKK